PRRRRWTNSSASSSTGSRSELDDCMGRVAPLTSLGLTGTIGAAEQSPAPLLKAGHARQMFSEAGQCDDVALTRRRSAEAEHLRRFLIRELLEVPQHEDFAVDFVEAI